MSPLHRQRANPSSHITQSSIKALYQKLSTFMHEHVDSSRPFIPIHVHHTQRNPTRQYMRHDSYWDIFTAWLRYYITQCRWDIERAVARRLHRRWGSK